MIYGQRCKLKVQSRIEPGSKIFTKCAFQHRLVRDFLVIMPNSHHMKTLSVDAYLFEGGVTVRLCKNASFSEYFVVSKLVRLR